MDPNANPAHNALPAKGTPDTQSEQPGTLPRTDSTPATAPAAPPVEAPAANDPTPEPEPEDTDPSSINSPPDQNHQTDAGTSTDYVEPL